MQRLVDFCNNYVSKMLLLEKPVEINVLLIQSSKIMDIVINRQQMQALSLFVTGLKHNGPGTQLCCHVTFTS